VDRLCAAGPRVNEKLHNYARLTAVIARAHQEGSSLETAIEQEFAWEALELDGQAAGRLARPLHGSPLQDFRAQFPQFRQYTPTFLGTFQFEAIPAQQPLLKALEVLRQMNREQRTRVPSDAPRSFVRPNWAPFVFTDGGIDRCYYELGALSELSLGLQARDIWVSGSHRYRKFDSYLIEPTVWAERKEKFLAQAEPSLDCETYVNGRKKLLDQELKRWPR
jgi:hypothetical protein